MTEKQGLDTSTDPTTTHTAKGGPGKQQQEWPGREDDLDPRADHGEKSYKGAGKLQGMKALITGGDSGIGRAVAIAFAREGADVAIAYYDEHEDAEETLRWVREAGRTGVAIPGDISAPEHCRKVVEEAVDGLGGLDILVNNAAFQNETSDIAEISDEQLERTFRTNIMAMFWITRAALEHIGAGGSVINTGSVTALEGNAGLLDYASTKGAIHVFTKSLSQQLGEKGIRVNCVAPGPVWTPLIPATLEPDHVKKFGSDSIWGRPAQPAEIAPSYVFLASADARYYTGEVLAPTGKTTSR